MSRLCLVNKTLDACHTDSLRSPLLRPEVSLMRLWKSRQKNTEEIFHLHNILKLYSIDGMESDTFYDDVMVKLI